MATKKNSEGKICGVIYYNPPDSPQADGTCGAQGFPVEENINLREFEDWIDVKFVVGKDPRFARLKAVIQLSGKRPDEYNPAAPAPNYDNYWELTITLDELNALMEGEECPKT